MKTVVILPGVLSSTKNDNDSHVTGDQVSLNTA